MKISALILAAALLVAGGWRVFAHRSDDLKPAVVTPAMDVHAEFSNDLSARVYRVLHEKIADAAPRPKLIALTFDDGPYPVFTPLLLDELHALHIPATFFLIGRDAEQWPEITRRIEADGNEIADHTYSHPNLDQETDAQVRDEITHGRDVLWTLTHDPGVNDYVRPPHGRYTEATLRVAQSLGYHVVLWTDDSGDWRTLTTAQIAHHLMAHATAPDIVLLHSGKLATIEALAAVVERFHRAGYEFVTVGDLLSRVRAAAINHPARHAV